MIDARTVSTPTEFRELLAALLERFPIIVSQGDQDRIAQEREEAKAACYTAIERRLEMLSGFSGVVCDQGAETHDQRQAARGRRAVVAKDFLNAYDHHAKGRNGPAPNSDFDDPRLMKLIVMAVRAYQRFESSRGDILGHLPTSAPAPVSQPAPAPAPAAPATPAAGDQ